MMLKNKRKLSFYSVLVLLSCVYSLSILLLSTLPIALLYQSIEEIEAIQKSFRKHPLVDLRVIKADNSQNCIDYQMERLFNFTFPGIKEGCLCSDGELKTGLCNRNMKGSKICFHREDGENIYEQQGLQINYWGIRLDQNYYKNSSNISMGDDNDGSNLIKFQLCGYYNQQYNFLDTFDNEEDDDQNIKQQISQPNTCNYKNKEYDLFDLSKFNNITIKDCPITKIELVNQQQISDIDNFSEYVDIPTAENFKIKIQRSPQQYAISDIEVSQGEGVCRNGQVSDYSDQKYKYYLYDNMQRQCKKENGYNIIEWSELGQKDLFKINGQEEQIKKIPKFINNNKSLFYIYTRNFPQISYQCRTTKIRSLLLNEIDIYKIWFAQIFLCAAAILYLMIIQFFKKGENKIKILTICKIVLSILHVGIEIWISIILSNEMILPIEELSNLQCVDKNTYINLIDIKHKVKLTQFYIQLPFYIYIGILSIEIIYFASIFIRRKLLIRKNPAKKQKRIINEIAIVNNLEQLNREVYRVQESAHNRNPRQEQDRASQFSQPQNIINSNSVSQIRVDEDSELQEKGNSTKDTNSLKRDLELF